jgi:beta-glucosidase/6-phospho-beta-glucosidase/beta-galactosidase
MGANPTRGTGAVNQMGIDHYSRLTDAILEANIRPFCTIRIYDLVTQISKEYNCPIIEISENGCCYLDNPDDRGRIPDARRISFQRQILAELARAIADGAKVRAYHAWSLVDNFE